MRLDLLATRKLQEGLWEQPCLFIFAYLLCFGFVLTWGRNIAVCISWDFRLWRCALDRFPLRVVY